MIKYTKNCLSRLTKLNPIPTGIESNIDKSKKYRALIFDIYGTLLISASGDIDEAVLSKENLLEAFSECQISINSKNDKHIIANDFLESIKYEIKKNHKKCQLDNIKYPEVIIEDIWQKVIFNYKKKILISFNSDDINIKKLILIFELKSNPVWPMPNMVYLLNKISSKNISLGIISNAQFYTPLIMNHFINNSYKYTDRIPPFKKDLTAYSYQHKRAKPDISLFETVCKKLESDYSISRENILYVGNDMLKDIYPASNLGIDTALFAGDKRSLRVHKDNLKTTNISPTHTISKLEELIALI